MNLERKTLADLFARLHGMGVESADLEGEWMPTEARVLRVLSEMMNVATPGITMSDVLDAAKKAGVY